MNTIIILVIAFFIALFLIVIYNKLIRLKNMMKEAWSGIDVQLKKRYDLIPNLVVTVKGYAKHEQEIFENVALLRTEGIKAKSVKEQERAESQITSALGRLFAVAENYPDLKANSNFLDLQNQLSKVENDIQMARRYYNGTVRENNIIIESFPSNLVASLFSFKKGDYFELESLQERSTPEINM